MKIRSFLLIVSMLGTIALPSQAAPKSMLDASPAISVTKEVWRTFTNVLASNWVNAISSDRMGNVWFGTKECAARVGCWGAGVSKFDGTKWTTYTAADGLASNVVHTIASDAAGNVWFGTDGGLSKFDGNHWTTYSTADGLPSNIIGPLAIDSAGNVWVGTDNNGVSKFDGVNWITYTKDDGLANNSITSIASDPMGNVWIGTWDSGVSKFDGSSWTTYTNVNNQTLCDIRAITSDSSGNVWFGTGNRVNKFDGVTWTTYTPADGLAGNYVTAIACDIDGNLWFGTSGNGVSEFYKIHLSSYYAGGAPGSYFNLNGDNFDPNWSGQISVNGSPLGNIPIPSNGVYTFTLSTAHADEGIYFVKVGDHPAIQLSLTLDSLQPIRPKEGDYVVIDIPAGIALTPRFYLPALRR